MRSRKRITVYLKEPERDPEALVLARNIVHRMEQNPRFASPPITYVEVKGHIDVFADAQQKTSQRTAGFAADRDAAREVVMQDLMILRAYVQKVAQTSPAEAAAIVGSAGMTLRRPTSRTRAPLTARCTSAGTVHLIAKAAAAKAVYYWQYSLDGETCETWNSAPETLRANTTISGLPSHTLVYFRFRALTSKGMGDFCQVVSQLVT